MYCAPVPNGWKTKTTGAGVRASTLGDLRTMNTRRSPLTSMLTGPVGAVAASPAADAGLTEARASRRMAERITVARRRGTGRMYTLLPRLRRLEVPGGR